MTNRKIKNSFQQWVDIRKIKLSLASSKDIENNSRGLVHNMNIIHYRTLQQEVGGLNDLVIFGPQYKFQCKCETVYMSKRLGMCNVCNVPIGPSYLRKVRSGHINLPIPIVNPLYISTLASLLELSVVNVESLSNYSSFMVTVPGESSLSYKDIIPLEDYTWMLEEYEDNFEAISGAEAISHLLAKRDWKKELQNIQDILNNNQIKDKAKRKKLVYKFEIISSFKKELIGCNNGENTPDNMILTKIPVLPAGLRPSTQLSTGKTVFDELHSLYRKIIYRSKRLEKTMQQLLGIPEINANDKALLFDAVQSLICKSKTLGRGTIMDKFVGKQGLIRNKMVGKRYNHSARAAIITDSKLKIGEVGIPYSIIKVTFEPFIVNFMIEYGIVSNYSEAVDLISGSSKHSNLVVETVINKLMFDEHGKTTIMVLINRAPTLFELNFQAMKCRPVYGDAIRLNPLELAQFGADCDGDTVSASMTLTIDMHSEALSIMNSNLNIFNPVSGEIAINPSKDLLAGLYYLTIMDESLESDDKIYVSSLSECETLETLERITIHTPIISVYEYENDGKVCQGTIKTTYGRLKLWEIIPKKSGISFSMVNTLVAKKECNNIVQFICDRTSKDEFIEFLDDIKDLAFYYCKMSDTSIGLFKLPSQELLTKIKDRCKEMVIDCNVLYMDGMLTKEEKERRVTSIVNSASDKQLEIIKQDLHGKTFHPYEILINSGARGNYLQLRQYYGQRGNVLDIYGNVSPFPIIQDYSSGLSPFQFYAASHASRRSSINKSLGAAIGGYFFRRCEIVANPCTVVQKDCGTEKYILLKNITHKREIIGDVFDEALGYILAVNLKHPVTGELIMERNTLITRNNIDLIRNAEIFMIPVRSVIHCRYVKGVCSMCYGMRISNGKLVANGTSVGQIAAQGISEPGTQGLMKTFGTGGIAITQMIMGVYNSPYKGYFYFTGKSITTASGKRIIVSRRNSFAIRNEGDFVLFEDTNISIGAEIQKKDGEAIELNENLFNINTSYDIIVAQNDGFIKLDDCYQGVNMEITEDKDKEIYKIVKSDNITVKPRLSIVNKKGEVLNNVNGYPEIHYLDAGVEIVMEKNGEVKLGQCIMRTPKVMNVQSDISEGVMKAEIVLECRKNFTNRGMISPCDGFIQIINSGDNSSKMINILDENKKDILSVIELPMDRVQDICVSNDDVIKRGEIVVLGNLHLQDVLDHNGIDKFYEYATMLLRLIYHEAGVFVHRKHIFIILKMLSSYGEIIDKGDSNMFVKGQVTHLCDIEQERKKLKKMGKKDIKYRKRVLGLTKAGLFQKTILNSIAFQETDKGIVNAAVKGLEDDVTSPKAAGMFVVMSREIGSHKALSSIEDYVEERETVDNYLRFVDEESQLPIFDFDKSISLNEDIVS